LSFADLQHIGSEIQSIYLYIIESLLQPFK
jgi:hypothetical protein